MRRRRALFAEPVDDPSGVWVYLDDAGDVVFECGLCGAWWFPSGGRLDGELVCGECSTVLYARKMYRPPQQRVDPELEQRTPRAWLDDQVANENQGADLVAALVRSGHYLRARQLIAELETGALAGEAVRVSAADAELDAEHGADPGHVDT